MVYKFRTLRFQMPVLVVGHGRSGKSIHQLLQRLGCPRDLLFTYDDQDPDAQLHNSKEVTTLSPGTIVVSPGVPLSTPWIKALIQKGCVLSSELEIAAQLLTFEKLICVTGSVGKSTVAAAIAHGLGSECFLGGNFGTPLAEYVNQIESGTAPRKPWLVLELSSYQLENFPSLRSQFSVITSLTPNHLERYPTLEDYYLTKLSLVKKTLGPIILNSSGFDLKDFYQKTFQSTAISERTVFTDRNDVLVQTVLSKKPQLLGSHNWDNLALAIRLGQLAEFQDDYFSRLLSFPGLSHRLENLGTLKGVTYINDSKATTIASVLQAVQSLQKEINAAQSFHLLIGGRDKNLPWHDLKKLSLPARAEIHFFGESAEKAKVAWGKSGNTYKTLAHALTALKTRLSPGSLVLLSPGGTSLDEFKSFEDRGNRFKKEISGW